MEKKRNKKKLFAIIGGSVLAFVLTIALSVSITLAYFGGTGTAATSVSLGGSVEVFDGNGANAETLTMTGAVSNAVPGQAVPITVDATIKSSTTQQAAVILLVKGGDAVELAEGSAWTKSAATATVDSEQYAIYVYGTDTTLTPVAATAAGVKLTQFAGTYTVPKTYTNANKDSKVLDIEAIMVAVQNGTSDLTTGKAFTALDDIFQDVLAADYAGATISTVTAG